MHFNPSVQNAWRLRSSRIFPAIQFKILTNIGQPENDRLSILLSAYACEPGKGSEPGVGWRWSNGLAGSVDLHVLTRESNRGAIEAAVDASAEASPIRSVRFLYYDLPAPWLWAKRMKLLPTIAYYFVWQWAVSRKYRPVADAYDIVHHLTFCTLLCPGFWKLQRARYVLGPVGAPQVNPHYYPLFGEQERRERLRSGLLNRFIRLPWLRRLLTTAAAVVPANTETRGLLSSCGVKSREVMLDTGAPEGTPSHDPGRGGNQGPLRLMYAGQLERRKGLELSIRALALVSGRSGTDWIFDIYGSGPDSERLLQIATELGISDNVMFHGQVAQSELSHAFGSADVFLFTSLRDTSGGVNLEAMAHGVPIVCLAHQGVGDITDDGCAERIAPAPIPETITALADGIQRMADDPGRRATMGMAAAKRAAEHFSWDEKFTRMVAIYKEAGASNSVRR
jgi:glycosyltransferase involved in cell wall biosynthesis